MSGAVQGRVERMERYEGVEWFAMGGRCVGAEAIGAGIGAVLLLLSFLFPLQPPSSITMSFDLST